MLSYCPENLHKKSEYNCETRHQAGPSKPIKKCNFPPETNLQRVSFLKNVLQFHQRKPEREICVEKFFSTNSASTLVCLGRPTRTPLSLSGPAQRWHICSKEMLTLNSKKCVFLNLKRCQFLIRRNILSFLDKNTYSARSWFSLAARPSLFARSDVSRCWSCSVTWK